MIDIFAIDIRAIAINSTNNEDFPVKTLENEQKKFVLLYDK